MSFAIGIVGLIAAIVILATKIVELKLAVVKYRKENPQPTTTTATTTARIAVASPKANWSRRELWEPLLDLFVLVISYVIVVGLFLSKGPVTKQDLGVLGIVVVFWFAVGSLKEKP